MNENRIEKKFVLGKFKDDFFKKFLLVNGFTKQYPDRIISSIYLDTANYDFAKDNINGVSERKKIRFRWYNNDLDKIYIEEKNKKNFNVWKNISKINLSPKKENIVDNLKDYFYRLKKEQDNSFNFKFILKTNYKRSYWLSNNNKIRATIDVNINASPLNSSFKPIEIADTVLEFKFSPKYEKNFRDFFSKKGLNIRSQKYSKYVKSFIELENSGLIN